VRAGADIWIETSRPGTHDIDAIRAAHPELVVVPITDFGQTRPYRDQVSCPGTLGARLIGGWPQSELCGLRVL
jgi:hypothetical protein